MPPEGDRPPARPRPVPGERFPGRLRVGWPLPEAPAADPADEISRAARRLRQWPGAPPPSEPEAPSAPLRPAEPAPPRVSAELEGLDRRLRGLASRLEREAGEAPCADEVAEALLARARAWFDEWRLLLLEESGPDQLLADFASSSYAEQLERHHARFFLLLDASGQVLRAAHPERAGPAAAPARGARPSPAELEGLQSQALGAGRILVRPEPPL